MRRKTVVWAYLVVLSLGTILSLYIPKNEVTAKEAVTIPGDAIRLRILANSDLESDQALKRKVRDAVNAKITVWVQDLTSLKEARKVIVSKLPELQATAEEVVKREGSDQSVKVKFGKVQFPTKLYGEFLYPAGEYEAVLITLGAGKGANWWCVLFPPLCFLDFSNGVAVSDGFEDKKPSAKAAEPDVSEQQAAVKAPDVDPGLDSQTASTVEEGQAEVSGRSQQQMKPTSESQGKFSAQAQKPKQNGVQTVGRKQSNAPIKVAEDRDVKAPAAKKAAVLGSDEEASAVGQTGEKQSGDEGDAQVSSQPAKVKKTAPVYTAEDEQPVKVKFFVVELWEKMFE